jgi:hypothetical protein
MAELFRFIEQTFVVPTATPAIDAGADSTLQKGLHGDIAAQPSGERARERAGNFLTKHFSSSVDDPFGQSEAYLDFGRKLRALVAPDAADIDQLIQDVFGRDAATLVASKRFASDKALLNDILVSVKITTAFDRVDAHRLVAMRRAIAFLEDFTANPEMDVSLAAIVMKLQRPVRIPGDLVKAIGENLPRISPSVPTEATPPPLNRQQAAMLLEQRNLKSAYEAIMRLPPSEFELRPIGIKEDGSAATKSADRRRVEKAPAEADAGSTTESASLTSLGISRAALERLDSDVRKTLEHARINVAGAPVSHVVSAIKRRWQDVSRQLAPSQIPAPARVFRVGAHLFAVSDAASVTENS